VSFDLATRLYVRSLCCSITSELPGGSGQCCHLHVAKSKDTVEIDMRPLVPSLLQVVQCLNFRTPIKTPGRLAAFRLGTPVKEITTRFEVSGYPFGFPGSLEYLRGSP
jgi:hypothetical protein